MAKLGFGLRGTASAKDLCNFCIMASTWRRSIINHVPSEDSNELKAAVRETIKRLARVVCRRVRSVLLSASPWTSAAKYTSTSVIIIYNWFLVRNR